MKKKKIYKLIVADDEAIIRDGISTVVPWGENGFELSGMFENGKQALEFMEDHHVDVVITDINMPRMDGLELARQIARDFPEVMVLFLTGYDEFEYAMEAVKTRVRDFLLKPITAGELAVILRKVRSEIDDMHKRREELENLQIKLQKSLPIVRERFFQRLVRGKIPGEQLGRRLADIGWNNFNRWYCIAAVYIPEGWKEIDRMFLSEKISEELNNGDVQFTDHNDFLIILIQSEKKETALLKISLLAKNVFHSISHSGLDDISIGLGEAVDDPVLLHKSYNNALNTLHYLGLIGFRGVQSSKELGNKDHLPADEFYNSVEDLLEQLRNGTYEKCKSALDHIFNVLEEHFFSRKEAVFYFSYIYSAIVSFIKKMELHEVEEMFSPLTEPVFGSIGKARAFFSDLLDGIDRIINKRRNDIVLSRIDKAKMIIEEKYSDQNFSLQDICDEMFLSISQFSSLFKTGTGKTFVDYLTEYRIEKARQLLKSTDMRTYEIAEAVGYFDPRYFSMVFKKRTGQTAREYQRSLEE